MLSGFTRRLCVFALALVVVLGAACGSQATAQSPFADALAGFANDDFGDTTKAVNAVAASGAPQAALVLEALANARLFYDPATKKIFYRNDKGALFDAAAATPVADAPAKLETVRINNRLRAVIANLAGSLGLRHPDAAKRQDAALALLTSRDDKALPALDAAMANEKNAAVLQAMEQARAAIILARAGSSRIERAQAIGVLRARGDQRVIAALAALPADADADTRALAQAAIASIEQRQKLMSYAQNVWYGLSLGSVLLLAAIGLAITFGVMGVINMAHGEMVMLGAYTTFLVQEAFRAYAPGWIDWSLPLALPAAFLVTGFVGVLIERGVIRFLYGRPLETLLATWGVSLILQQAVRTAFGPTNREVSAPNFMSGAFDLFGLSITWGRLWIVVFTLVLFAALLFALKATPLGVQMRAVTQNRRMASAMGIRTPRIDALTFGLGSGLAGLAGVALSQIDNVSPNLGQSYIIDSFMVVVFGGVGNLWGTLVSAFALGVANKFMEPFAGAVLAKILILVLLILFIQKRPRGLFALKGRAVEA